MVIIITIIKINNNNRSSSRDRRHSYIVSDINDFSILPSESLQQNNLTFSFTIPLPTHIHHNCTSLLTNDSNTVYIFLRQ